MNKFELVSKFHPRGDQPKAISELTKLISGNNRYQTLLGVTGSGKTFTMASAIAAVNKPTLVISHNKTLAAQLYSEFKEFFPYNAVEYFISYYDYYQPEAYIPQTDTYIEKDASINERIDRLRLSATTALTSRRDVIVVASVSCIYNLGSPDEYRGMFIRLLKNKAFGREALLKKLIQIRYERNDIEFLPGRFRVRGDTVEIFPAYEQSALRVEFFSDNIEKISLINPISMKKEQELDETAIYPAKHFLVNSGQLEQALKTIDDEMKTTVAALTKQGKLLEAQRLQSRTTFDMEMLRETGICHGIENYSRHLSGRQAGSKPFCLLDYFPEDYLTIVDESHVTIPQISGMYNGDRARKEVLVEYGFRLPSCLDNRPLKFSEFEELTKQILFVSATPSAYELKKSKSNLVEQLIRPTGLVDPQLLVVKTKNQIEDLIARIKERAAQQERVLVTTLTKRMAEDLAKYLQDAGLKTNYLHSELDAIERVKVLRDLRNKVFDCLVGVNLLREGLDLPEVSLVCVMDADKEGFLRSETSLIQVSGRAARNINATVVFYADKMTGSLKRAIDETNRRRKIQLEYNKNHDIKPEGIKKAVKEWLEIEDEAEELLQRIVSDDINAYEKMKLIDELEKEMELAARNLQFEKAIIAREKIKVLKGEMDRGKTNFKHPKRK